MKKNTKNILQNSYMGKINKLTKQGETVYPITVSDAVINPDTQRSVTQELKRTLQGTGIDDYEDFSDAKSYLAGEKVWYDDTLYEFTADHAAGAWTGTDVQETNFKKELEINYGTYTDSPEFIRVYTDAEGKFLWGIRVDGSVEWAKGVPTPIQNAIRELEDKLKNQDIKSLQDAIDVINASLKPLTDTFSFQDSPEFVNVVTDADGKVLFGLTAEGKPYFPKNTMYSVESNQEFLAAWLDSAGHVLFGLRTDGSTYVAKADFLTKIEEITKLLDENSIKDEEIAAQVKQLQDTFSFVSNDEWLHAVVDAEGKLLFGIKAENGEVVMPKQDTYKVVRNDEWFAVWLDSTGKILFGVKFDGTFWAAKSNFAGDSNYDEQIEDINNTLSSMQGTIKDLADKIADIDTSGIANTVFSVIDDAEERLSVTTDKDERVISYRDKDGMLHEKKGVDTSKYYLNGEEKDFTDRSEIAGEVTKAAENGAVKLENVDGVSNHNTPNLLIADEMQKTFNDGTNSFTPPNEGYEMSNPIECQAGDWFTRTGTATGMVVVTDENDKNGTRLFNADGTTLGNTFQIPEDMTWVRYIRMAAEVGGATDGSIVICKGKEAFTGDNKGDYLTASKLRIEKKNLSKEVAYIKSEDGTKYYELYVDSTGTLKTKEVDPDIIPESDYPTNWIPFTLRGSFEGYFDRMLLLNRCGAIVIKAAGPTNYQPVQDDNGWGEFSYYNVQDGRYVVMDGSKIRILDKDFNFLDLGNTPVSDIHDVHYISDSHLITLSSATKTVTVPGDSINRNITGSLVTEYKRQSDGSWKNVGKFIATDYPQLCTDAYGDLGTLGDLTDNHQNTVTLDYDGNLIINQRNWDTWLKIRRVENPDGTVTLGSDTLDYNEAVIGRVGGRHNSGYLDSKRVLNDGFSFTDIPAALNEVSDDAWEEWQWFHCHDVKYWGMKTIGDKQYPTYTLFDNNYWTENKFVEKQYNALNKNNNILINPQGAGNYYLSSKDSDENYAKYTYSRVIQLSIDWENHKIMDYRVYYIPKMYSREQSGATMYDEGIISIAYSYAGEFGLWDFTTEETEVSGHIYKGAKELFFGKYDNYKLCYRANTCKLNV